VDVGDAGVDAEPSCVRKGVGSIARQEDSSGLEGLRNADTDAEDRDADDLRFEVVPPDSGADGRDSLV
jgi:hypothetical protein